MKTCFRACSRTRPFLRNGFKKELSNHFVAASEPLRVGILNTFHRDCEFAVNFDVISRESLLKIFLENLVILRFKFEQHSASQQLDLQQIFYNNQLRLQQPKELSQQLQRSEVQTLNGEPIPSFISFSVFDLFVKESLSSKVRNLKRKFCKCYFSKAFRLHNGLKVEQFERILWGYYPLDSLLGLIGSLSEDCFSNLLISCY